MEYSARLPFLFERYLDKQLSPTELEELLSLMQEAHADHLLTPAMQRVWDRLKEDTTTYPVDWNRMYGSITNTEADLASIHQLRNKQVRPKWYWPAAAVFVLLAGIGVLYIVTRDAHPAAVQVAGDLPANARPRQFQTIYLPDGSTVILNANSKLGYPAAFTGNSREVYLTGEGFFDIRSDAHKPFLVHTGNITTKVLGTTFNIKAYPADEAVKVTVETGKVQLLKDETSLGLIAANEQLSLSKKNDNFVKEVVDAKTAITWKPAEIIFNDITMEDAAIRLQQQFGMHVIFANADLGKCRITATFSGTDSPEEILAVLCGVSKATYTIQNNKITIYGKGCK